MNPLTTSAFDLPVHLAPKADPALIAGDEQHFAALAESLAQSIADLSDRLDAERKAPGRAGQAAMDRDLEVHRLTSRLRTLRRFGLDLCLGHIVSTDDPEPVYIGRLGLTDSTGHRLLLDWRSPAAEPFFGRPTPTRWAWPAAAGTAGPVAGSATTGTWAPPGRLRGARRVAGRPVRLRRQPGRQPVGPDARRSRHHPGRPGRHHPGRIGRRARRRRRPGYGQDRRRPAPLRVPARLRPSPRAPTGRCAVRRPAPAVPGLRRRRRPEPRRGGRANLHPARASSPRAPPPRSRPTPDVARPEVVRGDGDGDRDGRQVLRGAAHHGTDGHGRAVGDAAERRRLGRGVRGAGPRYPAQRGA